MEFVDTLCPHLNTWSSGAVSLGMAASKEWHMRVSWSLDELAGEMARVFGYHDRTALVKSVVRICALIGREGMAHEMVRQVARESPGTQDKVDAELLRMWRAGESLGVPALTERAKEVTGDVPGVFRAAASHLIGRSNGQSEAA